MGPSLPDDGDDDDAEDVEDIPSPHEPKAFAERVIGWETAPGEDLVVLARLRGRKGTSPAELHITAKEHLASGKQYVHVCVHFKKHGHRYRSRGAAIFLDELPAVVDALQRYLDRVFPGRSL